MADFLLEPFEFEGQSIRYEVSADEPHSRIFAGIAARGAMHDPDVAADIKRDHGPNGDYQAVFDTLTQEFQQTYLFGDIHEFFFEQARQYLREYPESGIADVIEFASNNRPRLDVSDFSPQPAAARKTDAARAKAKRKQKAAHRSRMRNKR